MSTNKFREMDLMVVLHKEHWSKILAEVFTIKMEYFRNNNTRIINPKQRAGKWLNIFEFYIHEFIFIILIMILFLLWFSYIYDDHMLFVIIIIICKYYAVYDSFINILHFVPLWNLNLPDRISRQERSWLCLSMRRQIFWIKYPTHIQLILPHGIKFYLMLLLR